MEETGVPEENHQPVASNWETLSHNVVVSTSRLELATYGMIDTDSNYHTITFPTTPRRDFGNKTSFIEVLVRTKQRKWAAKW